MNQQTPYDAEQVADPALSEVPGMRYLDAFTWVTESPKWLTNVLLAGVCQFIPVVGPIVILGYQFEIIESLHRRKNSPCPDFDFNRFVDYLGRGVWPFLVQMVVSFVMVPMIWVITFVPLLAMMGFWTAGGPRNDEIEMGTVFVLFGVEILLLFTAMLLFSLILVPLVLRAGLSQEFGQAFRFDWIFDFVRRMWIETLLTGVVVSMAMVGLVMVGYLMLCVGVYFTMTYGLIAYTHLASQLYELYLARGGEPVPLKSPSKPPAMTPPPHVA